MTSISRTTNPKIDVEKVKNHDSSDPRGKYLPHREVKSSIVGTRKSTKKKVTKLLHKKCMVSEEKTLLTQRVFQKNVPSPLFFRFYYGFIFNFEFSNDSASYDLVNLLSDGQSKCCLIVYELAAIFI